MARVTIRPDMRTQGGEVSDILFNGKYAGMMTLVFREGDRLAGSVQLERDSLAEKDKGAIEKEINRYVQSLIGALQAAECDVLVTYSPYEYVIATEQNVGTIKEFVGNRQAVRAKNETDHTEDDEYELLIVGEQDNTVEYHVYKGPRTWIAEALITIDGSDAAGEVQWQHHPDEDELREVTELIVSDLDDNDVDAIYLDMKYRGRVFDAFELMHRDYFDENDESDEEINEEQQEGVHGENGDEENFSVTLIRDDKDALTFDVYSQKDGGLPVGQATIDVSQRKLSGFVDFYRETDENEREIIASLLMEEMDKETEYDSLNLTMLYRNRPIDEILFEHEKLK